MGAAYVNCLLVCQSGACRGASPGEGGSRAAGPALNSTAAARQVWASASGQSHNRRSLHSEWTGGLQQPGRSFHLARPRAQAGAASSKCGVCTGSGSLPVAPTSVLCKQVGSLCRGAAGEHSLWRRPVAARRHRRPAQEYHSTQHRRAAWR